MKNLLIENLFLDSKEQAAGFPPFSRGYEALQFTPKIITAKHKVKYDFTLQTNSEEALFKLFEELVFSDILNPSIKLLLNFPIKEQSIVITRVLRTLLALIGQIKYSNASISKFCFYTKSSNPSNILTEYQYVLMSQINFFICDENYITLLKNHTSPPIPIDALYGSEILNRKTNKLFNSIWPKIYDTLNRSK